MAYRRNQKSALSEKISAVRGRSVPLEEALAEAEAPAAAASAPAENCTILYLDRLDFPSVSENKRIYPYHIFYERQLESLSFDRLTLLYGGNGSGKSTILNIIAESLNIRNRTQGNKNIYFDEFVRKCVPHKTLPVTEQCVFVRSEDIMNEIVLRRDEYMEIERACRTAVNRPDDDDEYMEEINELQRRFFRAPASLTSEERFRCFNMTADVRFSAAAALQTKAPEMFSNGETALRRLQDTLIDDALYLLDEPENSMAPIFQLELAYLLETMVQRTACQIIIATHSPFLLSIPGARIYDLDSSPVEVRKWHELKNMQAYYRLFSRCAADFKKALEDA